MKYQLFLILDYLNNASSSLETARLTYTTQVRPLTVIRTKDLVPHPIQGLPTPGQWRFNIEEGSPTYKEDWIRLMRLVNVPYTFWGGLLTWSKWPCTYYLTERHSLKKIMAVTPHTQNRIGNNKWRQILGEMQPIALFISGDRGMLCHIQESLSYGDGKSVTLTKGIHQALEYFLWLKEFFGSDLMPLHPNLDGYPDASDLFQPKMSPSLSFSGMYQKPFIHRRNRTNYQ